MRKTCKDVEWILERYNNAAAIHELPMLSIQRAYGEYKLVDANNNDITPCRVGCGECYRILYTMWNLLVYGA